jgi:hypothetical protein
MEFLAEREELEREAALQTYHVIGVEEDSTSIQNNGSDIIIPFCRLSITCDSFIPSTIRQ